MDIPIIVFWREWKKYGAKIYRTDELGEIFIEINKKGKIVNNTNR